MAKGQVWGMITFFAQRQGDDPCVIACPICGSPMERESLLGGYRCTATAKENMPQWLESAATEAGYNPWKFYGFDGALPFAAKAANGAELDPRNDRGRFGGWQWSKLPEEGVVWPDWFPQEDCQRYVEERWALWETELAQTLEQYPEYSGLESECHPVVRIKAINAKIAESEQLKAKAAEKVAKLATAQNTLNTAFAINGFFAGRLSGATLPEGSIIVRSNSNGDKNNPLVLVCAPQINTEQFVNFVAAMGDFSRVRMEGRFPVIVSPNPALWIGSKGVIAQALAKALGIRFLKVEKA